MQPASTTHRRAGVPRPLLAGAAVVLAAVVLTAAYSRRAPAGQEDPALAAIPPIAEPAADPLPSRAAPHATAEQRPRIAVTFRLDPGVTRGLYLGDRWVSPETFHFAQPGTQYVVRAKVQSIDAHDGRLDLSGQWSTDDPGMIAIERHDYGEVTLVVRQPGEGRLFVSAGGETKTLHVQARQTEDAMDVRIAQ